LIALTTVLYLIIYTSQHSDVTYKKHLMFHDEFVIYDRSRPIVSPYTTTATTAAAAVATTTSGGSTMTATNHDDQLGGIYPTMLNELNCTFGVSFSRLHCCGPRGHGLWPSWYRPLLLVIIPG